MDALKKLNLEFETERAEELTSIILSEARRYRAWGGMRVSDLAQCDALHDALELIPGDHVRINAWILPANQSRDMHRDKGFVPPFHAPEGMSPGWTMGFDLGECAAIHIPIHTTDQCTMEDALGRVTPKVGEVWALDVKREHACHNESDDVRIHLHFDTIINQDLHDLIWLGEDPGARHEEKRVNDGDDDEPLESFGPIRDEHREDGKGQRGTRRKKKK